MWWPSSMVCCRFNLLSSRENQKASSVWPLLQGAREARPVRSEERHSWRHRRDSRRWFPGASHASTAGDTLEKTTWQLYHHDAAPLDQQGELLVLPTDLGSHRNLVFSPSSLQMSHSLKEGWTNILVPSLLFTRKTDRLSTRCWKSSQSKVPCERAQQAQQPHQPQRPHQHPGTGTDPPTRLDWTVELDSTRPSNQTRLD